MKIRIAFTIDIDPEAWETEYGVERSEVREDVQNTVRHGVYAHYEAMGLLAKADQENTN